MKAASAARLRHLQRQQKAGPATVPALPVQRCRPVSPPDQPPRPARPDWGWHAVWRAEAGRQPDRPQPFRVPALSDTADPVGAERDQTSRRIPIHTGPSSPSVCLSVAARHLPPRPVLLHRRQSQDFQTGLEMPWRRQSHHAGMTVPPTACPCCWY